jgi:hypothetical protein
VAAILHKFTSSRPLDENGKIGDAQGLARKQGKSQGTTQWGGGEVLPPIFAPLFFHPIPNFPSSFFIPLPSIFWSPPSPFS